MRNTLVGMIGVFALTWLFYQQIVTDPLQQHGVEIASAKEWVRKKAQDPSKVAFEEISVDDDEERVVHLTFSWDPGPGGKSRNRWRFDFNKQTGRLLFVNDEDTGQMVAYGEETLAQMRAEAAARERVKQMRANDALNEAQWRLHNAPVLPGAQPLPMNGTGGRPLPTLPGT